MFQRVIEEGHRFVYSAEKGGHFHYIHYIHYILIFVNKDLCVWVLLANNPPRVQGPIVQPLVHRFINIYQLIDIFSCNWWDWCWLMEEPLVASWMKRAVTVADKGTMPTEDPAANNWITLEMTAAIGKQTIEMDYWSKWRSLHSIDGARKWGEKRNMTTKTILELLELLLTSSDSSTSVAEGSSCWIQI